MTQQQLDTMFGVTQETLSDDRRRELHNQGYEAGYYAKSCHDDAETACPAWLTGLERSTWCFGFDHGIADWQAERV